MRFTRLLLVGTLPAALAAFVHCSSFDSDEAADAGVDGSTVPLDGAAADGADPADANDAAVADAADAGLTFCLQANHTLCIDFETSSYTTAYRDGVKDEYVDRDRSIGLSFSAGPRSGAVAVASRSAPVDASAPPGTNFQGGALGVALEPHAEGYRIAFDILLDDTPDDGGTATTFEIFGGSHRAYMTLQKDKAAISFTAPDSGPVIASQPFPSTLAARYNNWRRIDIQLGRADGGAKELVVKQDAMEAIRVALPEVDLSQLTRMRFGTTSYTADRFSILFDNVTVDAL